MPATSWRAPVGAAAARVVELRSRRGARGRLRRLRARRKPLLEARDEVRALLHQMSAVEPAGGDLWRQAREALRNDAHAELPEELKG